jgi:MFS family permease
MSDRFSPANGASGTGAHDKARRTLPPRIAYALAAVEIGLGLFASVTPSPLYHTYSVLWHFSPLTLTLIYATYAFGVLATLLLAGRVSDQVGRRPVLLVALGPPRYLYLRCWPASSSPTSGFSRRSRPSAVSSPPSP